MRHESKFADFIRRGGAGSIDLRLVDLVVLERKFDVRPDDLVDSMADNALKQGLADLNQYLPRGLSANIKDLDFSDIKADLDVRITARLAEIGLPVDQNDPVIKAALQQAAAEVSARVQQERMGLTEYIWRSRDDARVRPAHRNYDNHVFSWKTPPEDGPPGAAYGCRCLAEPVFTMEALPEGATCERLTAEKLQEVFPDADEERLKAFAKELDAVIDVGKLDSPERLAHFLGQAAIEMGARGRAKEDFYYSVEALQSIPYYQEHPDEAAIDGYVKDRDGNFTQLPNEEAIANNKYAGINGNSEPGDGWRFAGRGLFHTTGRYNYQRITSLYQEVFNESVDFLRHPDLLESPRYAVRSAVLFWLDKDFATIADQGTGSDVSDKITRVINRGTNSYDRRAEAVETLAASGVLTNVCRFSVSHPSFSSS